MRKLIGEGRVQLGRGDPTSPSHPGRAGERIELIDVVRGFALYGVLLANLIWIAHDGAVTPAQVAALPTAALDRVVRLGVEFFIDWKFYTLFSFLFGLGFSVQLMRGERRGASVLPVYLRRLAVLFAFGLVFPGVDNWAHLGGFVTGFAFGHRVRGARERPEGRGVQLAALGLLVLTLAGFLLSIVRFLPAFLST